MKTTKHFWSYLTKLFLEWEMFRTKVVEEFTKHFYIQWLFFLLENRAVYEIMWKNIVERDRPQMTISHKRVACWIITKARHTLTLCNTYCSFTATMVARTCLSVTYKPTLPVLSVHQKLFVFSPVHGKLRK
jgi:BarA-like signal transduction histidine kinase